MAFFGKVARLPNFRLHKAVTFLLEDAKVAQDDRRVHGRIAFFQPAYLSMADSDQMYSVFTRDVSRKGMGLLHNTPIEPQIVSLTVRCSNGAIAALKLDIDWCMACGEGWYISGGGFIDGEPDLGASQN